MSAWAAGQMPRTRPAVKPIAHKVRAVVREKMDVENFMEANGFIKLADTVYTTAGDQFWARKEYILKKKSKVFVFQKQLFSTVKLYYKKLRRQLLN